MRQIENDGRSIAINSVDLSIREVTSRTSGTITVAIVQGNTVLNASSMSMSTYGLDDSYKTVQVPIATEVAGDFDVMAMYDGTGHDHRVYNSDRVKTPPLFFFL